MNEGNLTVGASSMMDCTTGSGMAVSHVGDVTRAGYILICEVPIMGEQVFIGYTDQGLSPKVELDEALRYYELAFWDEIQAGSPANSEGAS